jgi:hypothetical protein
MTSRLARIARALDRFEIIEQSPTTTNPTIRSPKRGVHFRGQEIDRVAGTSIVPRASGTSPSPSTRRAAWQRSHVAGARGVENVLHLSCPSPAARPALHSDHALFARPRRPMLRHERFFDCRVSKRKY